MNSAAGPPAQERKERVGHDRAILDRASTVQSRTAMNKSPTIDASALHHVSRDEALSFVDSLLGAPETWPSQLIRYRLTADFQSIWKEELVFGS